MLSAALPALFLFFGLLTMGAVPLWAGPEAADVAYREGFSLQKQMRTLEAISAYERALAIDPFHGPSHYEIGWSYWVLGDWMQVVRHWETALEMEAGVEELPDFLAMARRRLSGDIPPLVRTAIGTAGRSSASICAFHRRPRGSWRTDKMCGWS